MSQSLVDRRQQNKGNTTGLLKTGIRITSSDQQAGEREATRIRRSRGVLLSFRRSEQLSM